MELKVVDVNAIVEDMERLLRPLIGEDIELATELGPDAGHTRADAGQLEQVLMNLVVNAKDAMPDGGRITIQTSDVVVDDSERREHTFLEPGRYVLLSVIGHWSRHERRNAIANLRTVLHDQRQGQRNGAWTFDGVRNCEAERGLHCDAE